ncbi:MAG: oligosaccharide flippase family protein [Spirochaetaceae bacterium]|nr:oligosaccharide flippase family protein [Spirochaetaceae bacterium]
MFSSASLALGAHGISRGGLVLSSVVMARGLATEDFAAYSYFRETVLLIATYAALGLGVTATRCFAAAEVDRLDGEHPLPGSLSSLSLVASLLASSVVVAIPGTWITAEFAIPRWLLATAVGLAAFEVVPINAVVGLERYRAVVLLAFMYAIVVVATAWWSVTLGDAIVGMCGLIGGSLAQAMGSYVVVHRAIGWRAMTEGAVLRLRSLRGALRIAGPMFATSLIVVTGNWLVGRLMLEEPEGDRVFALYAVGRQWYGLGLVIPAMVSRVLLPRLVRVKSSGGEDMRGLVRLSTAVATVSAIIVAAIVVPLGPWLVSFYGHRYAGATWLIAAFMAVAVVTSPARALSNPILANDGQLRLLALTGGWLILLLGVSWLALRSGLGVWAGALSQAVAMAYLGIAAYVYCRRRRLI